MGVLDLIFKLNNFKPKISAILKHHCCHSNNSCDSFFSKKSNSVVIVFLIGLSLPIIIYR